MKFSLHSGQNCPHSNASMPATVSFTKEYKRISCTAKDI